MCLLGPGLRKKEARIGWKENGEGGWGGGRGAGEALGVVTTGAGPRFKVGNAVGRPGSPTLTRRDKAKPC